MKKNDFITALELLSENHSTELIINQPINNFVGELGSKEWTIHITNCVPAVINKLIDAGYSLRMEKGYGLCVCKW